MKNIKKLFAALLSVASVFMFFACASDTEDDDNLYVEFTVSGSDSDSSRTVEMKAPSGYEDKGIKIVYTLDGSKPDLEFKKASYDANKSPAEYIDYGTATLYESAIKIAENTTINALAFYVDAENGKCVKGSEWSKKTITVAEKTTTATTNEAAGASSGNFTFTLAETGNSNTTHYFDTYRTNVFKLNAEHPKVYYQTQFSWKGNGKGNWYLYMRDLNGGLVKATADSNFLAKGTYTGSCFDSTQGVVAAGKLTLFNEGDTSGHVATVTADEPPSFTLAVNNTEAATSSSSSTEDTLGTFTVADAK